MSGEQAGGSIEIYSGVSAFNGKGFCTVVVDGKHSGQLSPAEVRTMALGWLEAAEAAESDALVFAQLRDVGLEPEAAAAFLVELRNRRAAG